LAKRSVAEKVELERTLINNRDKYRTLDKLLSEHGHPLTVQELVWVSGRTEGYSASDLTNLARDAALGPLRSIPHDQLLRVGPTEVREIKLADFQDALQR